MTTATHFSALGKVGVCGAGPSKLGEFKFTGDVRAITCERCARIVKNETALGANCWALEALMAKGVAPGHLAQLFTLAVQKSARELQLKREHLEYLEEQHEKLVAQAKDNGAVVDLESYQRAKGG